MSVFDPYEHGARPLQSNNGNFNPLEHGAKPLKSQKQYSLGNRGASLVKSATAGAIGAVPDTAALAYNFPAMGINAAMRSTDTSQPFDDDGVIPQLPQNMGGSFANVTQNKGHDLGEQAPQLPLIPSATHAISKGIDNLTGGYTETPEDQKNWNQGIEFAASIPAGGGVASLAKQGGSKGLEKVANFAGSTNPWHAAGAGAAGYTTGALEDSGSSTSGAIAGGLAAGVGVSNIKSFGSALAKGSGKAIVGASGLGKNKIDLEAAQAAKNLDIELPAAALSESNLTALADQWIGKTPFFGTKLQTKYKQAEGKTREILDDIFESTGPRKTPEIEAKISELYQKRIESLPDNATIKPTHTSKALEKVNIDSALLSTDEKALLSSIETLKDEFKPSLKSKFGNVDIPLQESSVSRLAGTKRSINSIIKWDTDEGVKNQLRSIQHSLNQDIAEYGKKNPEWYKIFKEADDLFAQVAKRERVEQMLGLNPTNFATDKISFNQLAKVIRDPKSQKILEKQLTPKTLEKMKDLGEVARAFATKQTRVPNVSGTAVTAASMGMIYGLFSNPVGLLQGSGIATVIGAATTTQLITDQRIVNLALKFAEKPTEKAAVAFNIRMKQITGYTPVTLAREASKKAEEEQNAEEGSSLLKKFNDHIESNKQKPKGQALEKLMQTNAAKKGAQILGANPWR